MRRGLPGSDCKRGSGEEVFNGFCLQGRGEANNREVAGMANQVRAPRKCEVEASSYVLKRLLPLIIKASVSQLRAWGIGVSPVASDPPWYSRLLG